MNAMTFSGRVIVTVSIVVVGAILSGEGPRLVLKCSKCVRILEIISCFFLNIIGRFSNSRLLD